jgi:hypothetical protein
MKNILRHKNMLQLLERINKLQPTSQPLWGTMTPAEMLWHLHTQLELALDLKPQKNYKKNLVAFPPVRFLSLFVIPFPKGFRTMSVMNAKKHPEEIRDFNKEKETFLLRLQQTLLAPQLKAHPLFGKMNKFFWGRLIWKHTNYHLRQFGC